MDPAIVKARKQEGMVHLRVAADCAMEQHQAGRFWALEHPAGADSWRTAKCLKDLCNLDNVCTVTFDQCQFGLVSPGGSPLRKRTRIATNSEILAKKLRGKTCQGEHSHMRVTGSEFGVRISTHAQVYPPALVDAIAQAAAEHYALA